MRVILCNGVFDVLHIGHLEHLREARNMGDRLVVSLTADESVKKGPGRPINTWNDRAEMLKELRCVSEVIHTKSAVEAILRVRPNYFVKGIDYGDGTHFTENIYGACNEVGAKLRFTSSPKRSAKEIIKKAMA